MRAIALLLMIIAVFVTNTASAALKIDINQGNVDPLPIALNEFLTPNGDSSSLGGQIREVVENNLTSSGLFKSIDKKAFLEAPTIEKSPIFANWRQIGAFVLTTGRIKEDGDKITIEFRLWDPNMETQLEGTAFTLNKRSWRRAGHKIADQIYKRLTGEEGYFDTRILFVAETGSMLKRTKKLAIMDQDGENYKELTTGKELVLMVLHKTSVICLTNSRFCSIVLPVNRLIVTTGILNHLSQIFIIIIILYILIRLIRNYASYRNNFLTFFQIDDSNSHGISAGYPDTIDFQSDQSTFIA